MRRTLGAGPAAGAGESGCTAGAGGAGPAADACSAGIEERWEIAWGAVEFVRRWCYRGRAPLSTC